MDYKALQNGSDIRGIGSEGVEGQHVNLTDETVERIGRAFVVWLCVKKNVMPDELRIGLGRDSRISGPRIRDAIVHGMTDQGADVFDTGLASTPAMFMTTVTDGYLYDGAVMITASHLPMNRNGIKFFTKDGGLEKNQISEILEIAEKEGFVGIGTGKLQKIDFMSVYAKILADKIRIAAGGQRPLDGMKIVVDVGNGAGGFFVDKVLAPLGADTSGSRFLEPDGRFPNHIPNPEDKGAAQSIEEAVREAHADLGIVFDTDVDRAGAMDGKCRLLNKNRLIALLSEILLEEHPGTTIVTDSVTSAGLAEFIAKKGGVHHRFKRGYKNVINEAKRLNEAGTDCQLAMETSGHGALKENYFLDDGAYLMVKLIIRMARLKKEGRELYDLIAELPEPAEETEFRLPIRERDFKAYGEQVIAGLEEQAAGREGMRLAADNYEGARISMDSHRGWFLLRLSLHEPLMPLNLESMKQGGAKAMAVEVYECLRQYEGLDLSKLAEFAGV